MTEPCSSSSSPAPCTKAADSPRTPRPSLSLFHQWLLLTEAEQRVPGLHKLGRLPSMQGQNLLFCSVVTGDHSEARVLIPLRITSVLAQGSSHPSSASTVCQKGSSFGCNYYRVYAQRGPVSSTQNLPLSSVDSRHSEGELRLL